jgi:hypothetical protein
VDEYLHRAHLSLGRPEAAGWRHSAVPCYERIGARWWRDRLAEAPDGAARETTVTVHFHQNDTEWTVGRDGATAVLPDVKGLHYLRHLLQRPGSTWKPSTWPRRSPATRASRSATATPT